MSESTKLKILVFLRYLGDSFFYPFLSLYLNSLLFGESKIGFLIALVPLISIIMNPLYSKAIRNSKILKNVLMIVGLIEGVFILLIGLSSNFYVVLACIILIALSGCSHYGMLDALMTIHAKNHNLNFSSFRIFGSLAYVFGTAASGLIIGYTSYSFCFLIGFILFTLTSLMYLLLKPLYSNNPEVKEEKRSFKEVFKNKGCLLFTLFYVLAYGVIKTGSTFYGLLLNNRGYDSKVYGFVFSGVVIVEVVTMFILNKIDKKLNYKIMLFISILSITIANLINSTNLPTYVLIACWGLRGLAIAIIYHINYKVQVNLIGIKNITIVSLLEELLLNIFFISMYYSGGVIIEYISYNTFYLVVGLIGAATCIYYLVFVSKYVLKNNDECYNLNVGEENAN